MPNNLVTKDIHSPIVLNIVNNELDGETDGPFASPQGAYEKVAKILATINVPLAIPSKFEENGGIDVFDLSQYLSDLDGEEKLYLYFEYQKEITGLYTIFAEVVNQPDLEELIDNYNAEKQPLNEMIAPNKHPMIQALRSKTGGYGDPGEKIMNKLSSTAASNSLLGFGAFGSAYKRSKGDSEHVIKVYNDPAYHEYAKYAMANHHEDPHLPKIHAIQKIKGTNYHVARMEKLNPIKRGVYDDPPEKHEPWVGDEDISTAVKKHPGMRESLRKISSHLKSQFIDHGFDLHSGNIMKRDDGTPVLTDPVVTYSEVPHTSGRKAWSASYVGNEKESTPSRYSPKLSSMSEEAPPGDKYERIVKHIKKSYSGDGTLSKKEKQIAYATAWKAYKSHK